MDDGRIWDFETSLWQAGDRHYRESIAPDCLMVTPAPPYIATGEEAATAVSQTPRWEGVAFTDQRVSRPREGLIVIAYRIMATKAATEPYDARCTSVYLKTDAGDWQVVQHQQTPVTMAQT